jgi:Glycosyl transferase family 2
VRAKISAIILTLNEELLIERCITAVQWADEVVVYDSGSTDGTMEIASRLGARVVNGGWQGWARQRIAATAAAANDWVLFVDADEIVTSGLATELESALARPDLDPRDGFALDRRNEFLGVLLPNSQRKAAKSTFVRCFNRLHSGYDAAMLVHERVVVHGSTHLLESPLIQWRKQSTEEMVARINRYATIESEELARNGTSASVARLIFMPPLRFGWQLIVKAEWRLGRRGVVHAALRATADLVRQARLIELSLPEGTTDPPSSDLPGASVGQGPRSKT